MFNNLTERISAAPEAEYTLESQVRQLLDTLEPVTDMEYPTSECESGRRRIISFDTEGINIIKRPPCRGKVPWENCKIVSSPDTEGTNILEEPPWETPLCNRAFNKRHTLCKTALDEGRSTSEGVLQLISQLIARHIHNEQLLEKLQLSNAALTTASYTDKLTSLPNRRAVFHQLPLLFSRARDDSRHVLVVFADLDDFKRINDTYGHEAGDEFLCAIGARLKDEVRDGEVLGRVGGDEFIIAGVGPREYSNAQRAAVAFRGRLSQLVSGEYRLKSCVIDYPGPSVGAVAVDPATTAPADAVRRADTLMYVDKKRRRNTSGLIFHAAR